MANESDGSPTIPEGLWGEFIPRIKSGIIAEYEQLPNKSTQQENQNVDWMRAFLHYVDIVENRRVRKWSWLRENVTGLMMISAVMALAFGYLGAWGLYAGGQSQTATARFLDIAKLFAGALVGAAGATAAAKR
jgi:hypothetical protein